MIRAAALVIGLGLAAPAWAYHPVCRDLDATPRPIALADGLDAQAVKQGEIVIITGPGGATVSVEAVLPRTPPFEGDICLHDIDGDKVLDLLIPTGIGYGGVNVFYTFTFWRNSTWAQVDEVSNPEFLSIPPRFTSSMRSGPFWFSALWEFGDDAAPWRRIEQKVTFAGADIRWEFEPDGSEARRVVVPTGLALTEPARPAYATITAEGRLRAGTRVRIVDVDEAEFELIVESADGAQVRVSADEVTPED